MKKLLLSAALALPLAALASPTPLTVATWNLGWHLDAAQARDWIAACSRPFELQDGVWKPAAAPTADTRPGWALPWGRNAPVQWDIGERPPCDVFQLGSGPERSVPALTEADYAERSRRIGLQLQALNADVIAFQEVSGAQAIRELLGSAWRVCSYEGHKVQRLAIAWKASLGEGRCDTDWALSLPERPLREQVRPGLALTLQQGTQALTVMTVHLKSSCVSPLDEQSRTPGRGQLDGDEPNCQSLQAQVRPLEAWVEAQAARSGRFLLLGDFNRNLPHEAAEAASAPVRAANGRTRNLWRELNDGTPKLTLLPAGCDGSVATVCELARSQLLDRDASNQLRTELGCRNPSGLDHIVLGPDLQAEGAARKVGLGDAALTRRDAQGRLQLGLSDHCPLIATLR